MFQGCPPPGVVWKSSISLAVVVISVLSVAVEQKEEQTSDHNKNRSTPGLKKTFTSSGLLLESWSIETFPPWASHKVVLILRPPTYSSSFLGLSSQINTRRNKLKIKAQFSVVKPTRDSFWNNNIYKHTNVKKCLYCYNLKVLLWWNTRYLAKLQSITNTRTAGFRPFNLSCSKSCIINWLRIWENDQPRLETGKINLGPEFPQL